MFGIETLSGPAYPVAMLAVVLVEAIVLYVGYGALQIVAGPTILRAIGGR